MFGRYDLSETEIEIMEMIWEHDGPLFFSEILAFFNEEKKKNWQKQTLHTFLTRLVKKKALSIVKKGNKNIYSQSCSKDEYISRWTQKFLNLTFDGSLEKFMIALTGEGHKLSQKDAADLRKFLND